ncbi:fumarylacetoacetate hydrolase family protein [Ramlibacter sp.]|uniref:fumarylacetoacetate hydrolase family protein n=1 Tax=Ramlibacter sp. TaxID=1917967 RepID=UPI0026299887|nr:fumarylacetoacetate hydrolase family protein [Ramlibacter sp.]MDB5957720.1 fumarylacetoacetate hydrolase [Ramlibacter sp.]
MTEFVFPPAAPVTLPMAGSHALFPVGRVFCIGRNYAWSADEPRPRDLPAWFAKPASAVVPAEGALPYPAGTRASVTLAPGDLIFTGTPAGVAPLQAGDVVSGGVAGIAQFTMTVTGDLS